MMCSYPRATARGAVAEVSANLCRTPVDGSASVLPCPSPCWGRATSRRLRGVAVDKDMGGGGVRLRSQTESHGPNPKPTPAVGWGGEVPARMLLLDQTWNPLRCFSPAPVSYHRLFFLSPFVLKAPSGPRGGSWYKGNCLCLMRVLSAPPLRTAALTSSPKGT